MDDWIRLAQDWAVPVIALSIVFLSLCGITMGVRYIWRMLFHKRFVYLWHRLVRNPLSWLLQPLRRAHSRWSDRNQREKMAKWRKGHLANAFYETIHREIEEGRLSPQQGKQLQSQMAKFFGLDDLARIKTHADAIRHKLELNKEYTIGPAKPIPGPMPGENIVPIYKFEGLGSKFLNKKGAA